MDSIIAKVAYLNGLLKGLDVNEETKEGKAILAIADVLGAMAEEIEEIQDTESELQDYLDAVDEDLCDVEEELYGEDCECEDIEDDFEEVKCPHCGEYVYVDKDLLVDNDEITCPSCHKAVAIPCNV